MPKRQQPREERAIALKRLTEVFGIDFVTPVPLLLELRALVDKTGLRVGPTGVELECENVGSP